MTTNKKVTLALDDNERRAVKVVSNLLIDIFDTLTYEDNLVVNGEMYDRDFVESAKLLLSDMAVHQGEMTVEGKD